MPGNPRLVNAGQGDDIVDLLFAATQNLDDSSAGWIGERRKRG